MVAQHAADELVANAVEHAYVHRDDEVPGHVRVRVRASLLAAGVLQLTVSDQGRWRDDEETSGAEEGRGRGLALAQRLLDDLVVDRAVDGTTVTGRVQLVRPVNLDTTAPPAGPRSGRSRSSARTHTRWPSPAPSTWWPAGS